MRSLIDRLEYATVCLAGPGTIKERLIEAYSQCLADLHDDTLPESLQGDFARMLHALQRERALPGDSVLRASVRKLSLDEARQYTALIVRTYGALAATGCNELAASQRVSSPFARLVSADGAALVNRVTAHRS